jgi:NAD(P)-dependent dehydrogenase (short-subunit alcohol dehydrogenase family)
MSREPGALLSLLGATAVVTGARGGIGTHVVRLFRAAGARVLATDLPGSGPDGEEDFLPCDVSDGAAVAALAERVKETAGGLDVLVHAAGIVRDAVIWKMDPQDWDAVLRTNLDSGFHLLRAFAPLLRESEAGAVVLVGSINGERGKFGQANYAASKAGLAALGRTAARELGRFGVRVNVIAPGLIRTPMTDGLPREVTRRAEEESALGRIGQPEDVARAALFLCTALSGHVTGQVLRVDGGQLTV